MWVSEYHKNCHYEHSPNCASPKLENRSEAPEPSNNNSHVLAFAGPAKVNEPLESFVPAMVRAMINFSESEYFLDPSPPVGQVNVADSGEEHDSDREHELLARNTNLDLDGNPQDLITHDVVTAPLFSRAIMEAHREVFPQYGLFGTSNDVDDANDQRIYMNTNAPFATLICGVQGSGKSHSVSTILENCLIKDSRIGKSKTQLCGLVCHVDPAGSSTGVGGGKVCEAASLAAGEHEGGKVHDVTVLVSPSIYTRMKEMYDALGNQNLKVRPLFLSVSDLNITRMNALMSFDASGDAPLYMQVVQQFLRDIGDPFDYGLFKKMVKEAQFDTKQRNMLELRMNLLEGFVAEVVMDRLKGTAAADKLNNKVLAGLSSLKQLFKPGSLIIVDLTDPFIDGEGAATLFDIVISLFIESGETREAPLGKVLVLDEAHKYLTPKSVLSNKILSIIRQQRHIGVRTIISTQDPTTVPDRVIDLSGVVMVHRFSAVNWWAYLAQHLCIHTQEDHAMFNRIVSLRTGEGFVFAPMGIDAHESETMKVKKFGARPFKVQVRRRITSDSGQSVLAVKMD